MLMSHKLNPLLATVGAGVIALGSLGIASPASAHAREVISGFDTPVVSVENPAARLATLRIELPKPNEFDDLPPGSLPIGSLDGYTVELFRAVDVDVSTYDKYLQAREISYEEALDLKLVLHETSWTDSDGKVRFDSLPAGLYVIKINKPDRPGEKGLDFADMAILLPAVDSKGNLAYEIFLKAKPSPGGGTPPPPPTYTLPPGTPPPPVPPQTPPVVTPPVATPPLTPAPTPPPSPESSLLASTGASVILLAALGALALVAGFVLLIRGRAISRRNSQTLSPDSVS